jgi:CHASE3 domain sensor protein
MNKSIFNKQSLTFLFVIGIVILISVSVLTYMNIKDQNDDHEFIQQTFQRTALMDNIFAIVNESETSRRGYYLSSDKQYITDIQENKVLMDSLLKAASRQFA